MKNHWRKSLGIQLVNAYGQDEKVVAGLIGGSVGRGWEDQHSDLDLFVFWKSPPSEQDRLEAVRRTGGEIHVDWSDPPGTDSYRKLLAARTGQIGQIWPYESDEWSEHYYVQGVNIGISGFLVSTVDSYLEDLTEVIDPADDKEILISAVQSGVPVLGLEQIEAWRKRAADYPESLSAYLVKRYLAFEESWSACQVYADRGVSTIFNNLVSKLVNKIARILLAINKIYLPDPQLKWLEQLLPEMAIKPIDLAVRIRRLDAMEHNDIIRELTAFFLETMDQVDRHLPQVDTGFARKWIHFRRPVHLTAPEGLLPD